MAKSAGLLMYRSGTDGPDVLLVHPGGPYFARKNEGAWTIPKGLIEPDEEGLVAARREFEEETSLETPENGYIDLGEIRQKGGKRVMAWAFEGECDPAVLVSNTFTLEWPPRSGRMQEFPEIDRADWFALDAARRVIMPAQLPFLNRLAEALTN